VELDEAEVKVDESFGRVVPIYSEIEGIYPRQFRRIAKRAVDEYVRQVPDELPESIRRRRKLLALPEALRETHFPEKYVPGEQPRRRLAFDELFMVQLGLALRRRGVKVEPGIAVRASEETMERGVAQRPWPR